MSIVERGPSNQFIQHSAALLLMIDWLRVEQSRERPRRAQSANVPMQTCVQVEMCVCVCIALHFGNSNIFIVRLRDRGGAARGIALDVCERAWSILCVSPACPKSGGVRAAVAPALLMRTTPAWGLNECTLDSCIIPLHFASLICNTLQRHPWTPCWWWMRELGQGVELKFLFFKLRTFAALHFRSCCVCHLFLHRWPRTRPEKLLIVSQINDCFLNLYWCGCCKNPRVVNSKIPVNKIHQKYSQCFFLDSELNFLCIFSDPIFFI